MPGGPRLNLRLPVRHELRQGAIRSVRLTMSGFLPLLGKVDVALHGAVLLDREHTARLLSRDSALW